jgi:ABC-type sugar transport system ATPase subunit
MSARSEAVQVSPAEVLSARGLRKSYGGVHALRGVDVHVREDEVLGLVGENGSGKSTLLKILSGQLRPDAGTVAIGGRDAQLADPTAMIGAGVVTVTQETTLVPDLSVTENILLGRRIVRSRRGIDWRASRAKARDVLDLLRLDVDPSTLARDLRPDEQQMVEIGRAVSMEARLLILDEPTSSLTDDEVTSLFEVVRELRTTGVSTIFVSHRLNEVFGLTDRVTILRDGTVVGEGPTASFDSDSLIEAMVGRPLEQLAPPDERRRSGARRAVSLRGVTVPGRLDDVSLEVDHGEIVGLAGLVGSGRSDLLKAIAGHLVAGGHVQIGGEPADGAARTRAGTGGVAYVPADRKVEGLVLDMSVADNITMVESSTRPRWANPALDRRGQRVQGAMREFRIKADRPGVAVGTLSGGNQQKVMLAKWMHMAPEVLLLDEPTRGVDVGAKGEIYRLLADARANGCAIVVSSSETEELQALCDRVIVLYRGRVRADLAREEATDAAIAHFSMRDEAVGR